MGWAGTVVALVASKAEGEIVHQTWAPRGRQQSEKNSRTCQVDFLMVRKRLWIPAAWPPKVKEKNFQPSRPEWNAPTDCPRESTVTNEGHGGVQSTQSDRRDQGRWTLEGCLLITRVKDLPISPCWKRGSDIRRSDCENQVGGGIL